MGRIVEVSITPIHKAHIMEGRGAGQEDSVVNLHNDLSWGHKSLSIIS